MGWLSNDIFDHVSEYRFNTYWDGIVHRIQNSRDPVEREHLLVGFHESGGYPVLMPRNAYNLHAHLLGPSGTAKTADGILSQVIQLIRMAGRDLREDGAQTSSIVVIDLKGEKYLMESCRVEADRAGLPFKLVTDLTGLPSHGYNPLYQKFNEQRTALSLAQLLTVSLDLYHGPGYGRDFFSGISQDGLHYLIKYFRGHVHSIRQLYRYGTNQLEDPHHKPRKTARLQETHEP